MIGIYIKYVIIPVFGVKRYWCRFEFDKSRGQIHFHMSAICGEKKPHMLRHELRRAAIANRPILSLSGQGGR